MAEFGANIPGNKVPENYSGGPITPTEGVLSDFSDYGSYSGSDVKVVVHYPNAAKIKALEEANFKKETLTAEINNLRTPTTPEEEQTYVDSVRGTNDELTRLDNDIARLNKMPTSKVLANLQTLSYSTYRGKYPVKTFGAVYPRSFVRGHRMIAGSMVFTMFYEQVLHEVLDLNLGVTNTGTSDRDLFKYTTNLIDQIPPIDISIVAANEYGAISHMGLYGVEFVQDGGTISIEDIFTESVVQYVARDIDPLRIAGIRKINSQGVTEEWTTSAKGLAYEKAQENSYLLRRSPFI